MKRKINIQFAIITMVAIIFTVILSMTVYSELFQKEVRENLRICAYELKNTGIFDDSQTDYTMEAVDNVRITLIDTDGTVAFDTNASIGELDNHGQRPEIQEALQNGEGETMRRSAIKPLFILLCGWTTVRCCVWQKKQEMSGACSVHWLFRWE